MKLIHFFMNRDTYKGFELLVHFPGVRETVVIQENATPAEMIAGLRDLADRLERATSAGKPPKA